MSNIKDKNTNLLCYYNIDIKNIIFFISIHYNKNLYLNKTFDNKNVEKNIINEKSHITLLQSCKEVSTHWVDSWKSQLP